MLDVGLLALDPSQGVQLSQEDYPPDFVRRDEAVTNRSSWKFERRTHFQELNNPSWKAFRQGKWDQALRLIEERRSGMSVEVGEENARGNPFHRVRVVEEPLSPYLQWELHYLRLQAECGRPVRVVQAEAEAVCRLEDSGPLPEVVVLGGLTLFEVLYTEQGVPNGAVRFTDIDLVERWESLIKGLYENGEDVISYMDRYVSRLPAPRTAD